MSEPGVAVVIEDDEDVRNLVDAILKEAGFVVHSAATGREGVEVVRDHHASVVTLDIGLPDMDGHEVLRRIRQFSDAYVVMLTARRDEPDTLTAFLTGADDYVKKPFLPRELRARVTAMMRRPRAEAGLASPEDRGGARGGYDGGSAGAAYGGSGGPDGGSAGSRSNGADPAVIKHNGLALNYKSRTVTIQGSALSLTRSEFDLLFDLLRAKGEVRTRADLVRAARGDYYDDDAYISEADERAVETHIGNLRRKLREDPQSPRFLQTVRGVGYRLTQKRSD
ncbi:response regulator transcription factor [Arthrobacter bambusae]|uniref:response regulator transcription factor n=1 Tax=Arthrobacter bambusae TaxID=1338426 RepID=UPI002786F2E7|nr:response regulator transcription factor [Arthrobacter bambusae]MDQ0031405.1 DNA-binding response OmpR family regulator [Arthrobacter bambusae]MDQ0099706.1 DNA-binding response OmpR family regulator [Arthrobacter bambusae]